MSSTELAPVTTFAARTPAPAWQTDVVVKFFVPGKPAPQGSKRHVGHGIMVESSREVGPWRERVALAAHNAMSTRPLLAGAVTLALSFVLPRPKSTPKRRTPAATKRPDVDKLARAVLDAITDVVIVDDGQIDARLAIFVEDSYAELLTATALRYSSGVELSAIKIHGMGGASPAISVNEQHNLDPTSIFPSICLLDGDKPNYASNDKKIYLLPGSGHPEQHILDRVVGKLDTVAARLTVSMQLPAGQQERVKAVVKTRALTNHDVHVIWEQIGEDLDFTAGQIVATAFLAIWAQEFPDEVEQLVAPFQGLLPVAP